MMFVVGSSIVFPGQVIYLFTDLFSFNSKIVSALHLLARQLSLFIYFFNLNQIAFFHLQIVIFTAYNHIILHRRVNIM